MAWNTANDAVLAEGKRVLIADPNRFDGVAAIGVDEHVWRHTRRGDKYVTVIIDLTGIREGTGPARRLDMVEGRSRQAFKTWLADRPQAWRDKVEVVAMDGFTGFEAAAGEEIPDAVAVMDPFHVVRLAGEALDQCRRRVQLATCGHRGHKGDPLYAARRTLHTGAGLLTDKQTARLEALFAADAHVYTAPTVETVAALCNRWLVGRRDVREVTRQGYSDWLVPVRARLGAKRVQDLTVRDLDALVQWMKEQGGTAGRACQPVPCRRRWARWRRRWTSRCGKALSPATSCGSSNDP